MTEHPAAPPTEAGRTLIDQIEGLDYDAYDAGRAAFGSWTDAIRAIEAEARAAARKEVLDEIRQRLPGYMDDLNSEELSGYTFAVNQFGAILDSLSTDTREEPT